MSIEHERSYGGVVLRGDEVLLIVPAGRRGVLTLPKGGADEGESEQETALREVREETGVRARVVERLGDVEYWYRRGGRRVFKTVGFYLCDYVSGDTADHDDEVDEARWMPLERARAELTYPGERRIIEHALSKRHGDR
jgi:8-oxo-dGTP pyrophosphatase MutT (NUDIX family)